MLKDKYSRMLMAGDLVDYTRHKTIFRGVVIGFTAKRIKIITLKYMEETQCFIPADRGSASAVDGVDVVKL